LFAMGAFLKDPDAARELVGLRDRLNKESVDRLNNRAKEALEKYNKLWVAYRRTKTAEAQHATAREMN